MTRIGLLGGMSWESSAEYYRLLDTVPVFPTTRLHVEAALDFIGVAVS